jgi:carboxyl-terminal processing protease
MEIAEEFMDRKGPARASTHVAVLAALAMSAFYPAGAIAAEPALPATSVGPDDARISLADRLFIFSKSYASAQHYFAHWEDVPGLDLDALYRRYLPEVTATTDRYQFDLLMMRFVDELHNGHSWFRDKWLARTHGGDIGFDFRPVEGRWTVTASRTPGLTAGDVLAAINGEDFGHFFERTKPMLDPGDEWETKASFSSPRFNFVFPMDFELTTLAGKRVAIHRSPAAPADAAYFQSRWIAPNQVGYIRMTSFNDNAANAEAVKAVAGEFHNAPALIIDVRGYNGGSTPSALISALMDRPWRSMNEATALNVSLFQLYGELYSRLKGTMPDSDIQELATMNGYFAHPSLYFPGSTQAAGDNPYKGKLFIITDNGTVSAKEDFVVPFKDNHRAVIVGERTAGSTGQPYMFYFNKDQSVAVGAKTAYMPDGSRFEKVGILPDVAVSPTLEDVRGGRDTVLMKTIELAKAAATER